MIAIDKCNEIEFLYMNAPNNFRKW